MADENGLLPHTPLTCPSMCPACRFCTREAQAECGDPACHLTAVENRPIRPERGAE